MAKTVTHIYNFEINKDFDPDIVVVRFQWTDGNTSGKDRVEIPYATLDPTLEELKEEMMSDFSLTYSEVKCTIYQDVLESDTEDRVAFKFNTGSKPDFQPRSEWSVSLETNVESFVSSVLIPEIEIIINA